MIFRGEIKNLEELGVLEEKQEGSFTRLLRAKYKNFAEEEDFTPAQESWTWFGFDGEKEEKVLFQTSIQEIKNPGRKTKLTNLLSETKENLKQLKVLKRKYDPTCFFNKWIPIKI